MHLRVIPNAQHFRFIVKFGVYGGVVKFCSSVAHTLMRRYKLPHIRKLNGLIIEPEIEMELGGRGQIP